MPSLRITVPVHRGTTEAVAECDDILGIDNVSGWTIANDTHDTLFGGNDDLSKLNQIM